jgi:type IV pilus modification protein PilV
MKRSLKTRKPAPSAEGFTLIEVMIAMVILLVGLLMILALFAKGLSATQYAQQDMIAKQKAREQLEAIFASRNDGRVVWNSIQNVPTGMYLTGFNPLYAVRSNSTDIMGTTFNGGAGSYDFFVTRTGTTGGFVLVPLNPPQWQRQVTILPDPGGNPNLRQITVTVRVTPPGLGGGYRDYTVVGEISSAQ